MTWEACMKCCKCGAENIDNSVFCSSCGTKLVGKENEKTIHMITADCPKCGASLSIESNRLEAFCNYCGTKLLIHRDNEQIYHFIDEADIKRAETEAKNAETERIIKLKHLEEETKEKRKERLRYLIIFVACIFILVIGETIASKVGHSGLTTAMFMLGLFGAMFAGGFLLGLDKKKNE